MKFWNVVLFQQDSEYDLAELEARLYSQIHHSTELWDEPVDQISFKNRLLQRTSRPYSLSNLSFKSNRYWVPDYSSKSSSSPTNGITNNNDALENNSVNTLGNSSNRSLVPTLSDVISICDGDQNLQTAPQINSLGTLGNASNRSMIPTVNGAICIFGDDQNRPTIPQIQIIPKKFKTPKKIKQIYYDNNGIKMGRKRIKRHRQKMKSAGLDPNLGLYLSVKRPINIFKKDNIKVSSKIIKKNKVIVVPGDSDSDSIIEVPLSPPLIYTIPSSDDEEIEFEKQLNKFPDIIDLYEDDNMESNKNEPEVSGINKANSPNEILVNKDAEKIPEPIENIANKKIIPSTSEIENERSDLLCTPDSSVNDFIEQDVRNMNRIKFFNFNWHGDDLAIAEKEASKTVTTAADVYETESSCSEAGPRNRSFFNEVDFESPAKEIFCEPNLTKFSNFITPLRNQSKNQNSEFITTFKTISTKALRVKKSANEDTRKNLSCSSDGYNSDSPTVETNKKKSKKNKKQKKKKETDNQESDRNQQKSREKRSKKKSKSDTESRVGNEKRDKRKSASKSDSESNTEIIRRKKSKYQNELDVIETLNNETIVEQSKIKEKKSKKNYEGDKVMEGPKQKKLKIQDQPDLCSETSENIINKQRTPKEKKAKKNSENDKPVESLKQKKCKLQKQSNIIDNEIIETLINEQRPSKEKKMKKNSESDKVESTKEKKSKDIIENLNNEVLETSINEQCNTQEKIEKKNLEGNKIGESSIEKKLKSQDQSDIMEFSATEDLVNEIIETLTNEQRSPKEKNVKNNSGSEESIVNNERPVTPTQQKSICIEVTSSPKPDSQKEEIEIISDSTSTVSKVNEEFKQVASTSTKSKKEDSSNNVQILESPSSKTVLPATKSQGNSNVEDPVVDYYKDTYFADDQLIISEKDTNKQFSFVKSYDKIFQENTKEQLSIPSTSKETVNSQVSIIHCDSSDSDVAIIENVESDKPENISTNIILNVRQEVTPVESSVPSFSFISNFNQPIVRKTFSDFFTYDMNKFYNEPWGDELIDVKGLQASVTGKFFFLKIIRVDDLKKKVLISEM